MAEFIRLNKRQSAAISVAANHPPTDLGKYANYVAGQAGTISDAGFTAQWLYLLRSMGVLSATQVMWSGAMGRVIDPNTPGDTISKAFSGDAARNNLVQATKANQPLMVGQVQQIAEGLYNGNGGVRAMSHPAVTYAANEPWTAVFCLNVNGSANANQALTGPASGSFDQQIRIRSLTAVVFRDTAFKVFVEKLQAGKNNTVALIADGAGNLTGIINGVSETIASVNTAMVFAIINVTIANIAFAGAINAYRLQSGALTAGQVAAEAALLSAQWPDVLTALIGAKYFAKTPFRAVCSANGTLIPEVQATASWVAETSAWCYNNGNTTPDTADMVKDVTYGKLYNGAARTVIADNPPSGYHVATETELTALSLLDANSLKATGTGQWTTANGTNTTGLYLLGGGNRKADGSFNLVGGLASYWCADSNKVLLVTDAGVASIEAADVKEGHSILLVKD